MISVIREQPDDATVDDILRELALARMIERGLADSAAGRTISHEEMKCQIDSWRK
jgi:predicted transcriptional regulator